jgi:hypothetical protein
LAPSQGYAYALAVRIRRATINRTTSTPATINPAKSPTPVSGI